MAGNDWDTYLANKAEIMGIISEWLKNARVLVERIEGERLAGEKKLEEERLALDEEEELKESLVQEEGELEEEREPKEEEVARYF